MTKLYKYSGAGPYSLSNLEKRELCFQHYTRFNDPFEFSGTLLKGIPDPTKEPERFRRVLAAWGFDETPSADIMESYDEWIASLHQHDFARIFADVRVCCFAASDDNLLMWSHYGDGLRGFCLEFDADSLLASVDNAMMLQVEYADRRPSVDAIVHAVAEDILDYGHMARQETGDDMYLEDVRRGERYIEETLRAAFATKPACWSYEEERRIILQGFEREGPALIAYPPEALSGVILGELMSEPDRLAVMQALGSSGVRIRTARRTPDAFGLSVE